MQVTCPRCGTRQSPEQSAGYTCVSCGAEWVFAACANCGVRFHMRPGTTDWVCPECGHENGESRMGAFAPDEGEDEPAGALGQSGAARHERAPTGRAKGPMTRGQLAAIAVVGIAAVLVIAFALSSLGGDQVAVSASPTPSTSTQLLCLHLRDLQTPREDAFTRLATTLQEDAATIEAEGNADLAAAVLKMRTAVVAYRDALASQGDVSEAARKVAKASRGIPC